MNAAPALPDVYRGIQARFPPLSRAEEHALVLRGKAGDAAARDQVLAHSLSWAVTIAARQWIGSLPREDVVHEGVLGLCKAWDLFDPHAGTRFSTYALWWVRAYVQKHLRSARFVVHQRTAGVTQYDFALDAPLGDDADATHLDQLEDGRPRVDDLLGDAERDALVRLAVARAQPKLGARGLELVSCRLSADEPDLLETIGSRWGLSRQRVQQVEVKTRRTLRFALAEFSTQEGGDHVETERGAGAAGEAGRRGVPAAAVRRVRQGVPALADPRQAPRAVPEAPSEARQGSQAGAASSLKPREARASRAPAHDRASTPPTGRSEVAHAPAGKDVRLGVFEAWWTEREARGAQEAA